MDGGVACSGWWTSGGGDWWTGGEHRSRGDAHAPSRPADSHHRRRDSTTTLPSPPRPYAARSLRCRATPGACRSTSVFCIVVPAKPNTTTVARRRSRVRSLSLFFLSFPFIPLFLSQFPSSPPISWPIVPRPPRTRQPS